MNLLELENVTVNIGKKTIIEDISFGLQQGEVLALVGHNGAGKSTLMKTIMGVLEIASGKISINDYDQKENLLDYKKQLAYLPEEPMLLTELTVMQHFQLYGRSYHMEETEFESKVARYVTGFELDAKLDDFPESLSKGMRQKVQTICSLLPDVPVLLIDEPFMGLDIYAVKYFVELMEEKIAAGTSILLTSHQLEHVKDMANNFILLQNGEMVSAGAIADFETITRGTNDG